MALSQPEVLRSLNTNRPLHRFFNKQYPDYPFVRIYFQGRSRGISIPRVVWTASRQTIIPKGFEVHHIDLNPRNNHWENLVLLWKTDHEMLHRLLNGHAEEVPF